MKQNFVCNLFNNLVWFENFTHQPVRYNARPNLSNCNSWSVITVGGDEGVSILPEGPYKATAGSNLVFTCSARFNRTDSQYYKPIRNCPLYFRYHCYITETIKSRTSLDIYRPTPDIQIYNWTFCQVVWAG